MFGLRGSASFQLGIQCAGRVWWSLQVHGHLSTAELFTTRQNAEHAHAVRTGLERLRHPEPTDRYGAMRVDLAAQDHAVVGTRVQGAQTLGELSLPRGSLVEASGRAGHGGDIGSATRGFSVEFTGGTEVELAFRGDVEISELRAAVTELGFVHPEVIALKDARNRYILRLTEVSALPAARLVHAKQLLERALGATNVLDFKSSPGGDKIMLQVAEPVSPELLQAKLIEAGLPVNQVAAVGRVEDFRYQAQLTGIAEKLVQGLQHKLGKRAADHVLRADWVGPKAGAQLKDAAIKSILYAMFFIVVYVSFRFDLRFAPGAIVVLAHDALITLGLYVVLGKEISLGTIAAILTVIGFSICDTIVVYDRIRENMGRMRQAALAEIINLSTSQTLGRTVITSTVAAISVLGFFVWGTPALKDIVFALICGIAVGAYSSILVAGPLTEIMDRTFFKKSTGVSDPPRVSG